MKIAASKRRRPPTVICATSIAILINCLNLRLSRHGEFSYSRSLIAETTIKRIGSSGSSRLYLLPKAWFHAGGAVTRLNDKAFDLAGQDSHLVLADQPAQHWQIAQNQNIDKAQFDLSMVKQHALSDSGSGNMGMFEYDLDLAPSQTTTLRFALAEADTTDLALANAQAALDRFDEVLALRQSEAQALYRNDVSQHQDVYQSALQNLLWNKMFYAYDGSFSTYVAGQDQLQSSVNRAR